MSPASRPPSGGLRSAPSLTSDPFPAPLCRLRHRPLPPPEADPLFDVVSQTCPEGFHPDFDQPPQVELSQANLIFDLGIGELRHRPLLPVDLPSFLGFHLGGIGRNLHVIARRKTSVGLLHDPRLRIGLTHPRLLLGFRRRLGFAQLLQFFLGRYCRSRAFATRWLSSSLPGSPIASTC
jgi:hypothetical protein